MAEWVVTYTSMPIEADTAEEAISREGSGGGHWNAYPIRQHSEALGVHADIWPRGCPPGRDPRGRRRPAPSGLSAP